MVAGFLACWGRMGLAILWVAGIGRRAGGLLLGLWQITFIPGWCVVGPFRGQEQIVDSAAMEEHEALLLSMGQMNVEEWVEEEKLFPEDDAA